MTSASKRDVAGAWRRGVIVTLFGPVRSGGSRQEVAENRATSAAETRTWLPTTARSANGRWSRRGRKVTAREEARTRRTRSPAAGEGKPSVNPTSHRGVSEPGPVDRELRDPFGRLHKFRLNRNGSAGSSAGVCRLFLYSGSKICYKCDYNKWRCLTS